MIALGCDHGGYELMQEVIKYLEEHGVQFHYGVQVMNGLFDIHDGKKLAKTEREYSKLAKELLHREFSMALEVPYDEVENYITENVAALQK